MQGGRSGQCSATRPRCNARDNVTHRKYVHHRVDVHAGLRYTAPPSMHETLAKRHSDSVDAVEPHAPEHSAALSVGIIDEQRV